MRRKALVVGGGMINFEEPDAREWDRPDMAREARTKAIEDAGIRFEDIEQACVVATYRKADFS